MDLSFVLSVIAAVIIAAMIVYGFMFISLYIYVWLEQKKRSNKFFDISRYIKHDEDTLFIVWLDYKKEQQKRGIKK